MFDSHNQIKVHGSFKIYQEGHEQKSLRMVAMHFYANISNQILNSLES